MKQTQAVTYSCDAAVDLASPPAATRRYVQQGRTPQPLTRHLVDFKSIMAGGDIYRCARARDEQSGAVAERAHRVHPDYLRAARSLDTQFYAAPATPVMDRLMSHGQVRALVFGAHGEGSPDVHHCIEASARHNTRGANTNVSSHMRVAWHRDRIQARYRQNTSKIHSLQVPTTCIQHVSGPSVMHAPYTCVHGWQTAQGPQVAPPASSWAPS